ncbi:MAG: putative membrane protein [Verrucomicrobiales bacterium]|jgi:uncharacterized membrane protein
MLRPKRDDRGQTLLLAPIALLIVVILGSVTLEVGALHLRQRQLDDLADSIANDAATVGFDVEEFRSTGTVTINAAAASSVISPSIVISNLPEARATAVDIGPGPEPSATITLSFTHEFILGRMLFGASTELSATGEAALVPSN